MYVVKHSKLEEWFFIFPFLYFWFLRPIKSIFTYYRRQLPRKGFYPRLSMCPVFSRTISQISMQLGLLNLTLKCSMMSPGNAFISMSEDKRSRSRVTKTLPMWVFALFWVLASFSSMQGGNSIHKTVQGTWLCSILHASWVTESRCRSLW